MKSRDLAYIALFAAIVAALGLLPPVPVPGIPVPITAQTLGVMLAGSVLGARRGGLALLVFLAVVAVGLPVLSGGRGGLGVFVGPSAGFLYSWPIAAFVIGLLTQVFWRRFNLAWALVANLIGGVLVIYAIGIPFLSLFGDVPLATAFTSLCAGGECLEHTLGDLADADVVRHLGEHERSVAAHPAGVALHDAEIGADERG